MSKKRPLPTGSTDLDLDKEYDTYVRTFWDRELERVKQTNMADAKTHELPLARIKKIMKSDEDIKMISAEAPVLFAKACELFVLDITMRAWASSKHHTRRTLQRLDIGRVVNTTDMFDFVSDIVPYEVEVEVEEGEEDEDVGSLAARAAAAASSMAVMPPSSSSSAAPSAGSSSSAAAAAAAVERTVMQRQEAEFAAARQRHTVPAMLDALQQDLNKVQDEE